MARKYFCDKCDRDFSDPLQVTRIRGRDLDLCPKCLKKFRKEIEKTGDSFLSEKPKKDKGGMI